MGVISNVNLLGNYIQYGIRTTDHSMLLSLEREDCSATWNWWSRLENRTLPAGTGDAKEECDVVQGAFVVKNILWIRDVARQRVSKCYFAGAQLAATCRYVTNP
uniref:Uncharacterized protein n=1 Tax=Caenorhabditis japonica TaxID=281687 RepID=A0A8R1IS41_CAEJA